MRTRLLQDLQKKTIRFKSIVALTCLLLTSVSAFAQTKTVTGTVTDAANEPLIGASVLVQGTSTGTITDMDGKYSISVTPEDVLVFSYVGMTTQSVKVGAQNVINVTLKEDSQVLAETVVIGYGSAKKRDLTGSITNVKGEEIANKPATNPLSSLQGKSGRCTNRKLRTCRCRPRNPYPWYKLHQWLQTVVRGRRTIQ